MSESLLLQLRQGLQAMSLAADNLPLQAYLSYIELLAQWNSAYNLTSHRDAQHTLAYHILDSLAVLPFIRCGGSGKCLDLGTGAGLPGIILALAMPETQWVLLDSNSKKMRFVRHVLLQLDINNVEPVCSRVEDYRSDDNFSVIVTRAVATLPEIFDYSYRLLAPAGSILAMKGGRIEHEIDALNNKLGADREKISTEVVPLSVPRVTALRNLVKIMNTKS